MSAAALASGHMLLASLSESTACELRSSCAAASDFGSARAMLDPMLKKLGFAKLGQRAAILLALMDNQARGRSTDDARADKPPVVSDHGDIAECHESDEELVLEGNDDAKASNTSDDVEVILKGDETKGGSLEPTAKPTTTHSLPLPHPAGRPPPPPTTQRFFRVLPAFVNVRQERSVSSPMLARRFQGEVVEADAEVDGWVRCIERYGSRRGWLLLDGSALGHGLLLAPLTAEAAEAARSSPPPPPPESPLTRYLPMMIREPKHATDAGPLPAGVSAPVHRWSSRGGSNQHSVLPPTSMVSWYLSNLHALRP